MSYQFSSFRAIRLELLHKSGETGVDNSDLRGDNFEQICWVERLHRSINDIGEFFDISVFLGNASSVIRHHTGMHFSNCSKILTDP